MDLKPINKHKPLRHANLEAARKEVEEIVKEASTAGCWQNSKYKLHQVPVGGTKFIAADAKSLNKIANHAGRGKYRYLLDASSRSYAGLGMELDNGNYRVVA